MDLKEFKAEYDADTGIIKGYASTWDREPDSYGDIVAKGAFDESLKEWEDSGYPIPLLFGHNADDPNYNIGKITAAKEDDTGLYIEGEYDDSEMAQRVRELAKDGRVKSFSFAYEVLDSANVELENGQKARELRKLRIFEVSVVTFPANRHAVVTDAKSDGVSLGTAYIDVIPRIKAGHVLGKGNEDDLKQALSLIQGVLDKLGEGEESDDSKDSKCDNAEDGEQPVNAEIKGEIEETLKKMESILNGEN